MKPQEPEPVDPYQSVSLIFAMITTASRAIWESCRNLLTPINPPFWFLPWSPLLHWQYGNHARTCWPLSIPLSDFCHDHHCFIGNMGIMLEPVDPYQSLFLIFAMITTSLESYLTHLIAEGQKGTCMAMYIIYNDNEFGLDCALSSN